MKPMAMLSACSMLAVALNGVSQSGTDHSAVQKAILANEHALVEASAKNDPKSFHNYVVSDSYYLSAEGPMKAADFDKVMAEMKAACKIAKWGLSDSTFYWLNETTVVHMYKVSVDGTCQEQRLPAVWASTLWSNKNGKWLATFHQETPSAPAAAAPKK